MTLTECTLLRLVDTPAPDYRREWVGLLTVPNQELKATNWLKRLSWRTPTEVYWPHRIVQAPTKPLANGRMGRAPRPRSIFPGLLFASIVTDFVAGYHPWREIEATPGVRNYLRNGAGAPARISQADMAIITSIEMRENSPPKVVKPHQFGVRDKVKLTDDLLSRWGTGRVTRLNGDGSLEVEIDGLFGQVTRLNLSAQQVEAV